MAKRTIQECDLSKETYDPAETVTLVIKRAGKKVGRTYELSPASAAKLEEQLVSGKQLGENWSFNEQSRIATSRLSGRPTTDDFIPDDDIDQELNKKIAEQRRAKQESEEEEPSSEPQSAETCLHRNKGRPVMKVGPSGERIAYKICRDCRSKVPIPNLNNRQEYQSQKFEET